MWNLPQYSRQRQLKEHNGYYIHNHILSQSSLITILSPQAKSTLTSLSSMCSLEELGRRLGIRLSKLMFVPPPSPDGTILILSFFTMTLSQLQSMLLNPINFVLL